MKQIRESKRPKFTGRRNSHTFLALPHNVINSEEFSKLSGNATKMLIELARQFNGKNNGDLSAGWAYLRLRGWKSKHTLYLALHELQDAKFIVMTREGGRHRICSLYAITWKPIDDCGLRHSATPENVASNLWKTESAVPMRTSQVPMRTSDPQKQAA